MYGKSNLEVRHGGGRGLLPYLPALLLVLWTVLRIII